MIGSLLQCYGKNALVLCTEVLAFSEIGTILSLGAVDIPNAKQQGPSTQTKPSRMYIQQCLLEVFSVLYHSHPPTNNKVISMRKAKLSHA